MSSSSRLVVSLLLPAVLLANGWRTFDVKSYGAKGDGNTDDSGAIHSAYAACVSGGSGGVVRFPAPGVYVSGPIVVACNDSITLVELGSTLLSRNTTDGWAMGPDCPEPSQGKTSSQAAPFILLDGVRNVTVNGGGSVDANGEMWWDQHCGNWWCPPGYDKDNPKAFRPFMMRIERSSNVRVQNIEFLNPGFWGIVPVHSSDVVIENITLDARTRTGSYDTPNTDGVEPMWSERVLIRDAVIRNGDDCITIKSGSRDILAERIRCEHSHGITIGSVWYDDVFNITYRDVELYSTGAGPRIKGRKQGNATISFILFENVTLHDVKTAIAVDMTYETPGSTQPNTGVVAHNVSYRRITGDASSVPSLICLKDRPCTRFLVNDIDVSVDNQGEDADWDCQYVSIKPVPGARIVPGLGNKCKIDDLPY